jgi:histidine triad (HIT) family protein
MENCIFCKIVKGELPKYQVWEDDKYLAFLSIAPHHTGHTLLIPKRHQDYFFDLEDSEISEMMLAAKKISRRLKQVFKPKSGKIGLMLAGRGVPHVHIHLIPLDEESDLQFSNARHDVPQEEFEEILSKIGQIS